MSKRVNIILPDSTLKVLDRVAGKGDRSRFISQAVLHYVKTRGTANLRERLKQGPWPTPSWISKLQKNGSQWSKKHGRDSIEKNGPPKFPATR